MTTFDNLKTNGASRGRRAAPTSRGGGPARRVRRSTGPVVDALSTARPARRVLTSVNERRPHWSQP